MCKIFTIAISNKAEEELKVSKSESHLIRDDDDQQDEPSDKDNWDPKQPPQIKKLNLTSNNIEGIGLKHLCKALTLPTFRLAELSLSQNFLHYSGCKILVDALIVNTSLRKLHLASNFIKDEGAECLSFLLGLDTCYLEELDISDNFICTRGALALYSVLDISSGSGNE